MFNPIKIAALVALFTVTTTAAFAEAPSCPGGGTATGTFSCTGPVLKPVCTEGPPWKCSIKDTNSNQVLQLDGGSKPPKKGTHLQLNTDMVFSQ
jgi:hypothetical protein